MEQIGFEPVHIAERVAKRTSPLLREDELPLTPLNEFLKFLVIQKQGFGAEARIPLNEYSEEIRLLSRRERADALRAVARYDMACSSISFRVSPLNYFCSSSHH